MFTKANQIDLERDGVTVVPNVISEEDCDRHQAFFRQWLDSFPKGEFPQSKNSLIQRYKSGHLQPAWEARLAAKPVFSRLWGTEKLLSSMDAIAIGRPPEDGQEEFWSPDQNWLHVDQTADRKGLHGYQGAVYLEACDEDDWTFEVVKGSHNYFDDFLKRTEQWRCSKLKQHDIEWLEKKGCERSRIPCPKGGMILWDSRLFHANARPFQGRSNSDRWRFVIFVCMTPASWASAEDLKNKKKAYEQMLLTTHWPSQEVRVFSTHINKSQARDPNPLVELPDIAKTEDAQRLAGILAYNEDDEDGDSGGPIPVPVWDRETWATLKEEYLNGDVCTGRKGTRETGKKTHKV